MAVPREETYEYNGADIYIGTDGEGEFYANARSQTEQNPAGQGMMIAFGSGDDEQKLLDEIEQRVDQYHGS